VIGIFTNIVLYIDWYSEWYMAHWSITLNYFYVLYYHDTFADFFKFYLV